MNLIRDDIEVSIVFSAMPAEGMPRFHIGFLQSTACDVKTQKRLIDEIQRLFPER